MVIGPSAETAFRGVFPQRQVNLFFLAELANGRRDSFETPLKRDLDFFLGVGGSGRSPLNPPTPRYEGAGVRVDQEKKRKFIIDYREVMKIVIKCNLRRARGQGLRGSKCTPGCRRPPVTHGEMLPLTQRWRGADPQVARIFPVALQLGFMWGARVPGWDGLGGDSGR